MTVTWDGQSIDEVRAVLILSERHRARCIRDGRLDEVAEADAEIEELLHAGLNAWTRDAALRRGAT